MTVRWRCLQRACAAADAALTALIDGGGLRPGRAERAVARELEALMLDHGADGPSFETIVAAGANSAVPHHRPTDAVLRRGISSRLTSVRWWAVTTPT